MKQGWTYEEDEYCCESFIKKYIIDKEYFPFQIFVYNIKLKLKNLSEETIRMKISNIVYIANQLKIKHTCDISLLQNFSKQNLIAFASLLNQKNIKIDRNLVAQLIKGRFIQ